MTQDFDLLVIGAGSGGVRCARIAAQNGAKVAIVEARHWGGTCVNIGCVPKKLFVYASDFAGMGSQAESFGWDCQIGPHHWDRLIAAKNAEIERLNGVYTSMLQKAGVSLFVGTASFSNTHEVKVTPSELDPEADSITLRARQIVIAVGGAPVRPDIKGGSLGIVSDDAFYLKERPERLVIVGGGYIGVEFAGIFAQLGSKVSLVFRGDQVLRGFDQDLRDHLTDAIKRHGIEVISGASPAEIERADGQTLVTTLDNGKRLTSDCVFFAVGRKPNIEGLNLDRIGVKCENGRVLTGERFETSVPHIYAIGDVTDRINLTPVAIAQGHILAERLYGQETRQWSFETTPKAVFYAQPLASVGLTEDEAASRGAVDIYMTSFRPMRSSFSQSEDKILIKLVVDAVDHRVVGAHMMGDMAPEIIQGIAIAVTARLTKADFDRTIGIHPTAAEEIVTMRTPARHVPKKA